MFCHHSTHLVLFGLMLPLVISISHRLGYEAKSTNANIPEWKQRACEKPQKQKANSHYICDDKGDVKCLPGWQGDLCQVPMCRRGCDPMNGSCQRPGECRCRIGYTGDLCDKCIPLPGCQHGSCNKPFECICKPGWDGLFCTEPTCRQGCHTARGYCEAPGECRCRIGWAGRNCSDCAVMPGCQHGTCNKPLECNCLPGYTGLLCQNTICAADCHKQHGYCRKPGECRCKVGWTGANCDECFAYPGCVNGGCQKPWECNCQTGWGGMLCDEKLTCTCENGGSCFSLAKADGSYRCQCRQGYLGKNCEIVDEFMLTSTAAPRITPPPSPIRFEEEGSDEIEREVTTKRNMLWSANRPTTTKIVPIPLVAPDELVANEVPTNVATGLSVNDTTTVPTFQSKLSEANSVEYINAEYHNNDSWRRRQNAKPLTFPTSYTEIETAAVLNPVNQIKTLQQQQQLEQQAHLSIGIAAITTTKTSTETKTTPVNSSPTITSQLSKFDEQKIVFDKQTEETGNVAPAVDKGADEDDEDGDDDDDDDDAESDEDNVEVDDEEDEEDQIMPVYNNITRS